MATVATFKIDHVGYLASDGTAQGPLPAFAGEPDTLITLYRAMLLARTFDARAIAMQRTGQIGTFASSLGQEAVGVGVASAMRTEDVFVPSYRDHAAQFWRGVSMTASLLYWAGDERGSVFAQAPHDFPNCVPIGTQAHHAAGAAYAIRLRREPRVVVCMIGDGGTSRGDFYEAMNFSGVHALPVVFVISNNQWAISLPRQKQTAAQTLAQKAIAAGITGAQVDGNDVIAVRDVMEQALTRARGGTGPSVIEALTYRLGDHTTADDATRYRDPAELAARWPLEPVARLRTHLVARGAWSPPQEEALLRECTDRVNAAVEAFRAIPAAPVEAMFDWLHETLPASLAAQRDEAIRLAVADGHA